MLESDSALDNNRGAAWRRWLRTGVFLVVALLMGVSATVNEDFCAQIALSWWLPLLAGWLSIRYTSARTGFALLALSIVAAIHIQYSPGYSSRFELDYGFLSYTFFAALVVFSLRKASPFGWLSMRRWWRWSVSASTFFLFLGGAHPIRLISGDDLQLSVNVGASIALVLLAGSIRWRETITARIAVCGTTNMVMELLAAAIIAVASISPWFISPGDPSLAIDFAVSTHGAALALWFAAIVFGRLPVRAVVATILLAAASEAMLNANIRVGVQLLINPLSTVLLAMLLADWRTRKDEGPTPTWRNAACFAALVATQLIGAGVLTNIYIDSADMLVLAGAAFAGALFWQARGAIAAPLTILLVTCVAYAADTDARGIQLVAIMVWYSVLTFPYALAGLLASGYARFEPVLRRGASVSAGAQP